MGTSTVLIPKKYFFFTSCSWWQKQETIKSHVIPENNGKHTFWWKTTFIRVCQANDVWLCGKDITHPKILRAPSPGGIMFATLLQRGQHEAQSRWFPPSVKCQPHLSHPLLSILILPGSRLNTHTLPPPPTQVDTNSEWRGLTSYEDKFQCH